MVSWTWRLVSVTNKWQNLVRSAEPGCSRRQTYTRAALGAPRQGLSVLAVDIRQGQRDERPDKLTSTRYSDRVTQPALLVPLSRRVAKKDDEPKRALEGSQKRKHRDERVLQPVLRVPLPRRAKGRDGAKQQCKVTWKSKTEGEGTMRLSWFRESFARFVRRRRTVAPPAGGVLR